MKNVGILQNCNMSKGHWMLCEYLLTLEGSLQCCELSCLLDVTQITSLHMLQGASLQIHYIHAASFNISIVVSSKKRIIKLNVNM